MNPHRVWARNFRRFRDLDLALPGGCCAIVGPNGAGKSTLIDGIDLALFADGGRELAPWLTTGELDLELGLEFEHGGELYRIRRGYSAAGRGKTTLDFERWKDYPEHTGDDTGPEWTSLSRETAAATQQAIGDTLRLSRTTFRASAFSGQGDAAAFPDAAPKDRKHMLAEILDLHLWSRLLETARADAATATATITQLQAQATVREETIQRKDEIQARLTALAAAEQTARQKADREAVELENLQTARASADAAVERVKACEAEHRRVEADHARIRDALDEARLAETALPQRATQLAKAAAAAEFVLELEQELTEALHEADARREHDRLLVERNRLLGEASELNERAHELRQKADHVREHVGTATCDRCEQTLGAEAAERAHASYLAEADGLDRDAAALDEQAAAIPVGRAREKVEALEGSRAETIIRSELAETRAIAEQRQLLAAEVNALEQKATEIPDLTHSLAEAQEALAETDRVLAETRAALPDITGLDRLVTHAREQLQVRRSDHEQMQRQLTTCQAERDRIVAAEAELADIQGKLGATQGDLDLYRLAERAYGRDGIPALILENAAIPQIETEANRLLEQLPTRDGRVYRVELRTQRVLKSREGLAEALDIIVLDELGERPYETFSGGERARLSIALRLGLARLLANRRGAELKLLVLDEPEGLEEDAMLQLVDVLRAHEHEFGRIYVISHHPVLQSAFDQQLVVSSDGGRSRVDVVTGAGIEPVEVPA